MTIARRHWTLLAALAALAAAAHATVDPYHLERLEAHHFSLVGRTHAKLAADPKAGDPPPTPFQWALLAANPPLDNADQTDIHRIVSVNGKTVAWSACRTKEEMAPFDPDWATCLLPHNDDFPQLDIVIVTTGVVYNSGFAPGPPRPEQTVALTDTERTAATAETEAFDYKSPPFQAFLTKTGLDQRLPGECAREFIARFYRVFARNFYFSTRSSHWPTLSLAVGRQTACCNSASMILIGALRNQGVPSYYVSCHALRSGTFDQEFLHGVIKYYDEIAQNWCWQDPVIACPPADLAASKRINWAKFDARAYELTGLHRLYFTEHTGGWYQPAGYVKPVISVGVTEIGAASTSPPALTRGPLSFTCELKD
jgi:hypothetical protein